METSLSRPRREWLSLTWDLRCSVRLVMRYVRIATCTSGDPVSPYFLANALMTSALRSGVIDIVDSLLAAGGSDEAGQVEHALGDDFAAVDFGEGQ